MDLQRALINIEFSIVHYDVKNWTKLRYKSWKLIIKTKLIISLKILSESKENIGFFFLSICTFPVRNEKKIHVEYRGAKSNYIV